MASRKDYELAIKIAGKIEKSLPKSVNLTKSELRAISREAARESAAMGKSFKNSVTDVNKQLHSINQVGDKVFKAVGKAAKFAAAGIAVGLGGAIKVGSDFEAQMSTVQSISGATGQEFDRLSEKALKMGSTTSFTASEAGQAMEYMAMAGWKTEDMLNGIDGIMNLAAASGEDLATTSDIVTDALTAFGMSASDSAHFADVLAKASSASNTNVSMMGETFKYVGATAGAFGYTAEDVATSIGLMANAGIKASQGGTALRRIMTETAGGITLQGKAFAEAGEEIGKYEIATSNADGTMKPWSETVDNLRIAFAKMSDKEKAANAEAIAGKTGMSGLLAIVNAGSKDYENLTNEINNAAGAAKKMSDTRLDNLQGDVTLFKSALEGAGVTIYQELEEPLREAVQWGTQTVGELSDAFVEYFPVIRDTVLDVGDALGEFISPFMDVGEWLLENPEVISGAIGGIGAAIISFKVAEGITGVTKAIAAFTTLNPAIAAIGGAAAAIGAIAAATATAAREAKNASLDDAFGDIVLSMDELDDAARQIVGSNGLAQIDELFNTLSDSEKLSKSIEETARSIKKVDWKVNAGLKISKDDREQYANDVKNYVQTTQELIDQKGYEVSVSTKLLFGNSADAKGMISESDAFYAGLQGETQTLSKRLNKLLQDAVDNGFKPDTKKAINQVLDSIAEINEKVTQANAQADWDLLGSEWSGKDLTAGNYEALQTQLNENLEKTNEGIDEGARSQYASINARTKKGTLTKADRAKGYISEEEAAEQKKAVTSQAQEKKREASDRAAKFQYNTLMDTYGEKLASGNLSQAERDAINELTTKMLAGPGVSESSYGLQIRSIDRMSARDDSFASAFNPFDENGAMIRMSDTYFTALEEIGKNLKEAFMGNPDNVKNGSEIAEIVQERVNGAYLDDLKRSQEAAVEYQQSQTVDTEALAEQGKAGGEAVTQAISEHIGSDTTVSEAEQNMLNGVAQTAGQSGQLAGGQFIDGFRSRVIGQTITIPATIQGTVSGTTQNPAPTSAPVKHAKGGIFSKAHIGIVGEAGTESVIPIKKTKDAYNLYAKTGQMLGISPGGQTFAPVLNLTVNGGSKEKAEKIAGLTLDGFKKMYKQMCKESNRRGF